MSSWRSSNVDEMVRVTCDEEGLLLSKEEESWRVPGVVGFTIVCCGLPSAGGAPAQTPLSVLWPMMMA